MTLKRTLVLGGLAALVVLSLDRKDATAGAAYGSFGCGGFQCWGTLKAFRSSPDATDYASFEHTVSDSAEDYVFKASYGRESYWCRASSYLEPLWNEAMSGDKILVVTGTRRDSVRSSS
jgi:hypothetical protein